MFRVVRFLLPVPSQQESSQGYPQVQEVVLVEAVGWVDLAQVEVQDQVQVEDQVEDQDLVSKK